MLRRIILSFKDDEIEKAYNEERKVYYTRIMPFIAGFALAFSIVFELIYRVSYFEAGKTEG